MFSMMCGLMTVFIFPGLCPLLVYRCSTGGCVFATQVGVVPKFVILGAGVGVVIHTHPARDPRTRILQFRRPARDY